MVQFVLAAVLSEEAPGADPDTPAHADALFHNGLTSILDGITLTTAG